MRSPDPSILAWRKSSYSNSDGGQCVEVSDTPVAVPRATWRKSSYSNQDGGECVEVSDDFDVVVPVRDSKDPHGPVLTFPTAGWDAFVSALKGGALRR
ncbi:DUF397 domain-containing protein [Streptomyces albus subsp. chlorinus]|uniref:DUF397 domain-containing protein n=1 Tax=Streptomyces albus TaxID=1888 RepID=UPI00156FF584|nr:DUF397 domain-containing protein [Streptomyces albus]NSC24365.1 DUF397 domain-containing protein [Streptomyces albus subsp. chlorinus]